MTAAEEGVAWVDGEVQRLSDAKVPLTDLGYLLGDGVFETMRTEEGRVFERGRHMDRLRLGLAAVGILDDAHEEAERALDAVVREGTARFGGRLYARVQVTRLEQGDESVAQPGRVTSFARPLRPYPASVYERGVDLVVGRLVRRTEDPLVGIKGTSYLGLLHERRWARRGGHDDALFLNEHGRVCEGTHSNVLALVDGSVLAPGLEEGALDGVTRALALAWAEEDGLRVASRLPLASLVEAEEVVLTNTIGGVVPARSLAGHDTSFRGPSGAWYRALQTRWSQALAELAGGTG